MPDLRIEISKTETVKTERSLMPKIEEYESTMQLKTPNTPKKDEKPVPLNVATPSIN